MVRLRQERDGLRCHAEMFRGDQVEKKGACRGIGAIPSREGASEQDWAAETLWSAFRWSFCEINQSGADGKSGAQEARHGCIT